MAAFLLLQQMMDKEREEREKSPAPAQSPTCPTCHQPLQGHLMMNATIVHPVMCNATVDYAPKRGKQ